MQSTPLISVVIATRNRSASLKQALASVLAQRYYPLEIITVDDASSDTTRDILRYYQDGSGNKVDIKVITNATQLGLPASLNKAISKATGKYIARLDDDDVWIDELKLQKQASFLEENAGYAVIGTGYTDEQGCEVINPLSDKKIRNQILFRCPFCHSTVVIRKSALLTVHGYNESLPYAEDWELWLKIGQQYKLSNIADITVKKAFATDTLSSQYFVKQFAIVKKIMQPYWHVYSYGMLARFYHLFVKLFFTLVPVNSMPHRIFQRIFYIAFIKSNLCQGKSALSVSQSENPDKS